MSLGSLSLFFSTYLLIHCSNSGESMYLFLVSPGA